MGIELLPRMTNDGSSFVPYEPEYGQKESKLNDRCMRTIGIFLISLSFSALMLGLERVAGIGWDYHPDSVTYATNSTNMVYEILRGGNLWLIFNNGYYFLCYALGESIFLITVMNMLIYSATNVLLYRFHTSASSHLRSRQIVKLLVLSLLLLNPYRLHLSTTLLKDSIVIFLFVLSTQISLKKSFLLLPVLALVRIASAIYYSVFLPKRYLYALLFVSLLAAVSLPDVLFNRLLEFNEADMQLRDFDSIPTFQSYGLAGVFARGVIWPLLAVSGLFFIISPALAFFPVALGSVMSQLYCLWVWRRLCMPLSVYIAMAVIAMMAPGYTAFIRYVYPLMVVLPIAAITYKPRIVSK